MTTTSREVVADAAQAAHALQTEPKKQYTTTKPTIQSAPIGQ